MKTILSFLALGTVSVAFSQLPTPPPGGMRMPRNTSSNQQPQPNSQGGVGAVGAAPTANSAASVPTETIRVLSMTSVQEKLAITSEELTTLGSVARSLSAATTSEQDAFTEVAKVLTTAQTAQLQILMVQDLGYGALALTGVRTQLTLTDAQSAQVTALLATLEASKRAILSMGTNANAAVSAVSKVASTTNEGLAKVLTTAQDAQLRKLATETTAVKATTTP